MIANNLAKLRQLLMNWDPTSSLLTRCFIQVQIPYIFSKAELKNVMTKKYICCHGIFRFDFTHSYRCLSNSGFSMDFTLKAELRNIMAKTCILFVMLFLDSTLPTTTEGFIMFRGIDLGTGNCQ